MRLIDADSLHELIDYGFDLNFDEVPETKRELLRMVDEQPTIKPPTGYRVLPDGSGWEYFGKSEDTVEVVRCKDCRFYRFYDGVFGKGWMCFENNTARHGDDYCSRGERKDG